MSPDMTIESALADPMIRCVMRADRVEPQAFERFLRSAAGALDKPTNVSPRLPIAAVITSMPSGRVRGFCCA